MQRTDCAPTLFFMTHSPLVMVATGALVFVLAAVSDYLETRYVSAVGAHDARGAARCSVLMWLAGVIGLAAVLEVGLWVVLPEGAGLYVGTLLAMRESTPSRTDAAVKPAAPPSE